MKGRTHWGIVFVMALIVGGIQLVCWHQAQAAPEPAVAQVIFVQGKVERQPAGTTQWIAVQKGAPLAEQDVVKTGPGASAEIALDAKQRNVIRLGEKTEVTLASLKPYRLTLPKGELTSLIKAVPRGTSFEVRTPTAVVGVRGTGWLTATDGRTTTAASFEKSIFTKGIDPQGQFTTEATLRERQKTTIDELGRVGDLIRVTEQELERWNAWKEDVREHLGEEGGEAGGGAAGEVGSAVEEQMEKRQEAQQEFFEALEEEKVQDRITAPPGGGS